MKTVILCGGLGTRLREETEFKPKPMVQIGGMPILMHIMKTYSYYGVKDFVLCLGYRGEMIKQYFLDQELLSRDFTINLKTGKKNVETGKEMDDWNVTLVDTGSDTMTGGRIKRIQKYVPDDEFFLTYGDGVADINIKATLAHHNKLGKIGTLTGVNLPSRFGMIKAGEDNIVKQFVEKPMMEDYVNGGYYVFKKDIFDYVTTEKICVFETGPLTKLANQKQLGIYPHKGFWYAMDTYRDFTELNKIWESGKAPWKVW